MYTCTHKIQRTDTYADRQTDRQTYVSQYPTALHLLHLISFFPFLARCPQVEHLVGKMGSWTR